MIRHVRLPPKLHVRAQRNGQKARVLRCIFARDLDALGVHGAAVAVAHLARTKEGRDLGMWPLEASE